MEIASSLPVGLSDSTGSHCVGDRDVQFKGIPHPSRVGRMSIRMLSTHAGVETVV
jgi:hypothetical protein